MRIQNITTFKYRASHQQKPQFQNVKFGNRSFGDEIRVKEVDYKGLKIPYVYMDNNYQNSLEDNDLQNSIRTAFRDDELFDDKKDIVDFSYSQYDDNDVVNPKKYLLSAKEDYLQQRKIVVNRNKDFETDIKYPEILYVRRKIEKDSFDYSKMLPRAISNRERKEAYKKLDEMSYLKLGDKDIYSFELNECLLDKYNRKHPISEIEEVLKIAKTEKRYKSKGKLYVYEAVSCPRIDIYFDLKEQKKLNSLKEYKKLVNFANQGYRGPEYLLFDLLVDLTKKAPLEKVLKTYSDTYDNRLFAYVDDEEDKQRFYEELSEILEGNKDYS